MNNHKRIHAVITSLVLTCLTALAADEPFNGLGTNLGNLYRTSPAQTRSISAENFSGAKGQGGMAKAGDNPPARELGQGWKVSPRITIKAGQTFTLADIDGPGCIQQIWMTTSDDWRMLILRFYWDDEKDPSVEVPMADFFASGWAKFDRCPLFRSLAVCVNPRCAFNCYWQMPFRKRCRITVENLLDNQDLGLFFQINYTLTEVPRDAAYFHAQFRRENPLKTQGLYTILDGVKGQGQYVGTYIAWGSHNTGWWGEGEIKFFIDGDKDFPTICGTGAEDYFCGSFSFELPGPDGKAHYTEYSTPYAGMPQVIQPDGLYDSQQRFSLYRWHITDPIRFEKDFKVTIQDLGWQSGGRYMKLQDDIASVAFWYQTEPHQKFPTLPGRDEWEWH